MYETLKSFFETHPLALNAAQSIKDGREIEIRVKTQNETKSFTFVKEKGSNAFKNASPAAPEFSFDIPESTAQELAQRDFKSVGEVGIFLFERIIASDPAVKVTPKLHVGFLTLMTGGYLGVLTAGGSDVAKFLASRGLANMGKLKDAISKMRSS